MFISQVRTRPWSGYQHLVPKPWSMPVISAHPVVWSAGKMVFRSSGGQCYDYLVSRVDCGVVVVHVSRVLLPANTIHTRQTLNIESALGHCWSAVVDGGPTLIQH